MPENKIPKQYQKIWRKALPLLRKGRPGDDLHAREVIDFLLEYQGKLKINYDILIPVAMMHDIGHSAILPEHFKFVTGPEKIKNGKLAHMLAGAKIAKDILTAVKYDEKLSKEIIEIISTHDFDQLENTDLVKIYNTKNKKIFHDFDSLDRYTETRLESIRVLYPDKAIIHKMLVGFLDSMFYQEIRAVAEKKLKELEEKYLK